MKRDMDLVRKILLEIESLGDVSPSLGDVGFKIDGYDDNALWYHLNLLTTSPYVVTTDPNGWTYRLSWEGHEFLDSIRDDTRWREIQKTSNKVGGMTFDLIAKVATELLTKAVSGQLGL